MVRRVALLLSALLLLATGCDTDPSPPEGGRGPSRATPTTHGFAPPAAARWAGAHRVVVAVPTGWLSIETPLCRQPPPHTVVYTNPLNLMSGCPYMPGPRREPTYLSIDPRASIMHSDRRGTERVRLGGGLTAYTWNRPHSKYGQTAGVLVPARRLAMYVHTSKPRLAQRIIDSVASVPRGFRLVPAQAYASHRLDDMMVQLRHHGLRPTYVEEPPGLTIYGYPGRFIRTDPPVGTALRRGASVTAYFSSGRLASWISSPRLARGGWEVGPPTSYTPRIDRTAALARLGRGPNERAAFLRRLTIDGRTRQAWLVVVRPHYAYRGQAVTLSVVDARTGRLWRADVRFPATR